MELIRLVETSNEVAATRSRKKKIAALADLLRGADETIAAQAISYLSGGLPQGKIGIGYAMVYGLEVEPAGSPSIELTEIATALDVVKATRGSGSQSRRAEILTDLLKRATEEEQSFLKRLLVGELRQGALAGIMADAIAAATEIDPDVVRRAAMVSGDLAAVGAAAVAGGVDALAGFKMALLQALQPMLAQTSEGVDEAITKVGEASVEWKLDGARVQVHLLDDQVKVFTRNLRDVTSSSGDVVAAVRSLDVRSIILDGESLGFWSDGTPMAFQDSISTFASESVDGLAVMFFDILHLDGTDLIDLPLSERLAVLDRAIPETLRIPRIVTSDISEAESFNESALAAGHEGVMVKAIDSTYEAGRRGASWLKVKPVHTLDLVVIGIEWGSGRRQGWLSNLHLGARDASTGEFVMLGKTFKGMTDDILEWQTKRFLELETYREGRVVYVQPEQVVEIAFDGVQRSTRYPGGVALRFARVKQYRDDKPAAEADTLEMVRAFLKGGS
ncbi:MAG: ATP-dependent DNA ligase [Acidimicrobiia bacterium]|nr:ATP-dependent DNA ligase [Acidimicrobiia bacterium]